MVHAAPALPLRLAAAVGYALLAGVLAAVTARSLRLRSWVAAGRLLGAATLVLALVSALALPPQSAAPDPSTGTWRRCTRMALPGGIALPGTATCITLDQGTVRVNHWPDGVRLSVGDVALAEAPGTGVATIDSTRAALATDVLNDRMGLAR